MINMIKSAIDTQETMTVMTMTAIDQDVGVAADLVKGAMIDMREDHGHVPLVETIITIVTENTADPRGITTTDLTLIIYQS